MCKVLYEYLQKGFKKIEKLNIEKRNTEGDFIFIILPLMISFYMLKVFNRPLFCKNLEEDCKSLNKNCNIITSKGYQYLGYWNAKVEESTRNIKSVSKKLKSVERNKMIVKQILEETNFIVDRQLELKAMQAIDRGQRTVQNLIKEIKNEMEKGSA